MFLFRRRKPARTVAADESVDVVRPRRGPDAVDVDAGLEASTQQIGGDLLRAAREHQGSALSAKFWSDKLMDWAMRDAGFKVQLFRFIDVFPTLRTPDAIHDHLVEYLTQPGVTPPPGFGLGLKAGGVFKGTMAGTIASQVTSMAQRFIAGADAASALPALRKNWDEGAAFSVDVLGEAVVSEAEAAEYRERYLRLIDELPRLVADWPANERLDRDHLGPIPRANVSIKISSLAGMLSVVDFDGTVRRLTDALLPILTLARDRGVFVNFDMEHHQLKDLTLELFRRCCEAVDFPAGVAMQAYLRSAEADASRMINWSRRTGRVVTVRLVKGAYWDYETIHADQMGWPVPVWSRKLDSDACFERVTRLLVDATPTRGGEGGVKLALGSHNVRSIARALALVERRGLPPSAVELQMLRGMADPLKAAAIARGLRLREYVPVGEMIPGMAYLVRRLLENTSNESWLRAGFAEDQSVERLLASPHDGAFVDPAESQDPGIRRLAEWGERHQLTTSGMGASPMQQHSGNGRMGEAPMPRSETEPFVSEPVRDFADAEQRAAFDAAVARVTVPVVAIDATVDDARAAVDRAAGAFEKWRDLEPHVRAGIIRRAAAVLRSNRDETAALVMRESQKVRADADADVCEAVDFCEYYAREAVELFSPKRLGQFAGELNQTWYDPRGVAVVISPWNFPLAIPCGMTVAALVTGNPTILKPAEQTPAIARALCDALWAAGVPRDVLQFVPGAGETVGAALVRDPRVALIAFTGSMNVGLQIIREAHDTSAEQQFVKRVVCEMGGKNAVIVDASGDLDEAVVGVRASAFGFAGQKCSAASRVVVLDSVHDAFVSRLVEATRSLVVGDPVDPATDVGPVIDDDAAAKTRSYIDIGMTEGRLAIGGEIRGRLVPPHIFTSIRQDHRLANEEIFGPVLSVIRAGSFEEALAIANAPRYKLTGGVFSRTPSHLERARRDFRVGNLYLNRGITGALVGRQPFGGFGMSGVGAKAGGPDYLLQFVNPRAVTENTLRRGFAPEQ